LRTELKLAAKSFNMIVNSLQQIAGEVFITLRPSLGETVDDVFDKILDQVLGTQEIHLKLVKLKRKEDL
jgi:hypothetical protein